MLMSFQYKKKEYDSIPILITLLGIDHHQEPVYRTQGIPMNQFLYCKEGAGELLLDNRKYVIEEGQGFLILKDEPHEYHALEDEDWVLDIIGFNGNIVPLLLRSINLTRSGAFQLTQNGRDLLELHYTRTLRLSRQEIPRKHMILSQEIYSFLTDISTSITRINSKVTDYGNPTITQVIEYMEANYGDDISLDTLAHLVSRTPEYLCSIFKEHTGTTINKYLNQIRLLQASLLLVQEPSMPINEIAAQCGFRSASYFGKQFLKQYEATPNQYRLDHII